MADRAAQSDVSLDALLRLDSALGSYATGARHALAAIRADFERRHRALHDLEDDARYELERLQATYDGAGEDDDLESLTQECDGAAERLAEIRRWTDDVDSQHSTLNVREAACGEVLQRSVPRAQAFLREKIDQLHQYEAVRLDAFVPAQSSASAQAIPVPQIPASNATAADISGPRMLRERPLPRGFRWVALSEIDLTKQLEGVGGSEDFLKVPYDEMRQGLADLRDEILPAMEANGGRRADYFRDLDQRAGRQYADGLQRVYEAFFGEGDFIYLVRRPDGTLDLINGRHRLKVAKDLGWDAIPAQVRE